MTNQTTRGDYVYKAEGALPLDAPTYVKRKADDELYAALLEGRYCYVLNTRQMGKSSLCVRTMARLREDGVVCGTVDLSNVASTEATQEQWYEALLDRLAESLGLLDEEGGDEQGTDFERWERENVRLPASTRFSKFVEWLVLKKFPDRQVVIFFDELESTLRKGFESDDFFVSLRACYNARSLRPELNRLTFAFLGVADPSDLIQDKLRTPFNIGRAVELHGFTLEEAEPLAVGLAGTAARPMEVLRAVLGWTGGQPFLTHKICMLVSEAGAFIPEGGEEEHVSRVVRERVLDNWSTHDNPRHLKTIENRIMESPKQRTAQLLTMYQQILKDGEIAYDNSPEQMELRLTGLVTNEGGRLKVYNRIYAAVFDEQWVETSLARVRPYAAALRAWYASDCQDETLLLRGNELAIARSWIKGKSLGNADWVFLNTCEQLEQREMAKAFDAELEAKRKLESAFKAETEAKAKVEEALSKEQQASRTLVTANRRARTILISTFVAVLLLMVGAYAYADQQRKAATAALEQVRQAELKLNITNESLAAQYDEAKRAKDEAQQAQEQRRATLADIAAKEGELDAREKQFEAERRKRETLIAGLTRQVQSARADAASARDREAQTRLDAEDTLKRLESRVGDLETLKKELDELKKKCPAN